MPSSATSPNPEALHLYRKAVRFEEEGDVYMAVKLLKKVVRLAPEWWLPYQDLGAIYKTRQEWKPTMHYSQKALERNPEHQAAWNNLALSATALRRWRTARKAWNFLGFSFRENDRSLDLDMGGVAVRLPGMGTDYLVWARRIDPARAEIISVPIPASGFRYRDRILLDPEPAGRRIVKNRKVKVFRGLELIKRSTYTTFEVRLQNAGLTEADLLADLCRQAGLGFDHWNLANRLLIPGTSANPEYYGLFEASQQDPDLVVGVAARRAKQLRTCLHNWSVITLKEAEWEEKLI
jgi:tetratricopeptide (TPR) repeat protein